MSGGLDFEILAIEFMLEDGTRTDPIFPWLVYMTAKGWSKPHALVSSAYDGARGTGEAEFACGLHREVPATTLDGIVRTLDVEMRGGLKLVCNARVSEDRGIERCRACEHELVARARSAVFEESLIRSIRFEFGPTRFYETGGLT